MVCTCDVTCLCEKICGGKGRFDNDDFKLAVLSLLCAMVQQGGGGGGSNVATVSKVDASATNVTLLEANEDRVPLGVSIYNDSSAVLTLKLGETATTTSFTVKLQAGCLYELPFDYDGQIDGFWASATGQALITEVTL